MGKASETTPISITAIKSGKSSLDIVVQNKTQQSEVLRGDNVVNFPIPRSRFFELMSSIVAAGTNPDSPDQLFDELKAAIRSVARNPAHATVIESHIFELIQLTTER